jgi:hypothetical protein
VHEANGEIVAVEPHGRCADFLIAGTSLEVYFPEAGPNMPIVPSPDAPSPL